MSVVSATAASAVVAVDVAVGWVVELVLLALVEDGVKTLLGFFKF